MRIWMLTAALAGLCLPILPVLAQDKEKPKDDVNSDEIIRKFAAKEAEFKEALASLIFGEGVRNQCIRIRKPERNANTWKRCPRRHPSQISIS